MVSKRIGKQSPKIIRLIKRKYSYLYAGSKYQLCELYTTRAHRLKLNSFHVEKLCFYTWNNSCHEAFPVAEYRVDIDYVYFHKKIRYSTTRSLLFKDSEQTISQILLLAFHLYKKWSRT